MNVLSPVCHTLATVNTFPNMFERLHFSSHHSNNLRGTKVKEGNRGSKTAKTVEKLSSHTSEPGDRMEKLGPVCVH